MERKKRGKGNMEEREMGRILEDMGRGVVRIFYIGGVRF